MPTTTPLQNLPIPEGADNPGDLDQFFADLANAVEKKLVHVYTDTADRDNKLTAPTNGMLVYLSSAGQLLLRTNSSWVTLWPQPSFTASSSVPANTTGKDGDIHFVI